MFINIMYNARLEAQSAFDSKEHIMVAFQKTKECSRLRRKIIFTNEDIGN